MDVPQKANNPKTKALKSHHKQHSQGPETKTDGRTDGQRRDYEYASPKTFEEHNKLEVSLIWAIILPIITGNKENQFDDF